MSNGFLEVVLLNKCVEYFYLSKITQCNHSYILQIPTRALQKLSSLGHNIHYIADIDALNHFDLNIPVHLKFTFSFFLFSRHSVDFARVLETLTSGTVW